MVNLRGRAWAAKRGLLRDESRTPGKFWVGKLLQKCAPMTFDADPGKILPPINFWLFLQSTSIYRSIWLGSSVVKGLS